MKYLKILGLAALAATVSMTFGAGSASGAVACTTHADPCPAGWSLVNGDTLTGSLKAGTSAVLKAAFSEVKCGKTHIEGEVTNPGGAGKVGEAQLTNVTAEECKCGARVAHVTWVSLGPAVIDNAGTVTNAGSRFTAQCTGLASCGFGTTAEGTHIGKITDSTDTGGTGEFHAAATLTWSSGTGDSGQFVCAGFGDTGTWTANYQLTSPDALWLAAS